MSGTKTAKKVTIWVLVVTTILSAFGIPISPQVVSVIGVVNEAIYQTEDVNNNKKIILNTKEIK